MMLLMASVRFFSTVWFCISCARATWPAPQEYTYGSSVVWLSEDLHLVYEPLRTSSQPLHWLWDRIFGAQNFFDPVLELSENETTPGGDRMATRTLLEDAFIRMKQNIMCENIVPKKFYPRNANFEPDLDITDHPTIESIVIKEVKELKSAIAGHALGPEAYSIKMEEDGSTVIRITSSQGGLNALQTFSQLFFAHSRSQLEIYSPYAPLSIIDTPNFSHRGLNLDISRNWIPPEDVMRTIEAMAATKLNKLHLHAADAQSWPIEIPALRDLALKGAYEASQIWTTADLQTVQHHGSVHGVEVFLEIDLPGHARAIGYAYPNLIVAADEEQWLDFALQPPAGQLRLNSLEVTQFVTTLLHDLLPRTSRWSSKFHIGGDELNTYLYTLDPNVRSSSPTVLQPLIQDFVNRVISITQSHGVQPIIWEEMVLDWNLTLPSSIIVQTWRSSSALNAVLLRGHSAIFGSSDYWYLDCGFGHYLDPNPNHPSPSKANRSVKPPYLGSCNPYKNWRHVYSYNPLKGVQTNLQHLIQGGEVHLWGELTDSVSLDGKLWPRVAAAAEVMWSGTEKMPDEGTTRRLAEFRERLVARGVRAEMVQMEWCLRYKGGCTL